IDLEKLDGKTLVAERSKNEKPIYRIVRVVIMVATFVFAAPIKLLFRAYYKFHIVQPQELLAKVASIEETNQGQEKIARLNQKKRLLADAFAIQVSQLQGAGAPAFFALGETMTQYAISVYGDKNYPDCFERAKAILFGALNAQLYAVGAISASFDFAQEK